MSWFTHLHHIQFIENVIGVKKDFVFDPNF
jgi:hypothetical protein